MLLHAIALGYAALSGNHRVLHSGMRTASLTWQWRGGICCAPLATCWRHGSNAVLVCNHLLRNEPRPGVVVKRRKGDPNNNNN